ncbi:MAG: glycosyltransferase family 4 protein, partial [Pseudomonadales bacterium]
MKIGIDATCWWNNRGFGRFTRELLTALFNLDTDHSYVLFVDQPIDDLSRFTHVSIVEVGSSRPTTEAAVADSSRSPLDMYALYKSVARTELDLMYFPAVYSWFPVPQSLPTMLTVMDAIAEHYPELIFPKWKNRFLWSLKVKLAIWNSQRILTLTEASKQEIVEYIGAPASMIDIAGCAPSAHFEATTDPLAIKAAHERAGLPPEARILVYVGGLAPHKNLLGLLDGFEKALSHEGCQDLHLALVGDFAGGGFHSNYESLKSRVKESHSLSGHVHFSGYLSEDDLVALYSSAVAAAMPSYSEGFGLPAIEAMACGAPVLSSTLGSLPEVVGEAGIYFDPYDIDQIADAIVEMTSNSERRAELSAIA